jgi:hypothetical protein
VAKDAETVGSLVDEARHVRGLQVAGDERRERVRAHDRAGYLDVSDLERVFDVHERSLPSDRTLLEQLDESVVA